MWALVKLGLAPTLAAEYLFAQTKVPGAGTVAALVAIASLIGSALVIGYFKAAADKSKQLLDLSGDENRILQSKADRLEKENTILRSQPNLEQHARLLQKQLEKSDIQIALLREIKQSQDTVIRHVAPSA